MSFIDHKSNQPEEICNDMPEEPIDDKTLVTINPDACKTMQNISMDQALEKTQNYEVLDHRSDDDDDDNEGAKESRSGRQKTDKKVTLSIIQEYKQHPCLWNYLYKTTSRFNRNNAIKEIANIINWKCKTRFTDTEMRNKLGQLRGSYRRVLRNKEAFEKKHANAKRTYHPKLWYFDKMSFIGTSVSEFAVSRQKAPKTKSDEDQCIKEERNEIATTPESDDESNIAEEDSEPEEETKAKGITKNEQLLTCIIKEYKKMPCLWAVQHYTKGYESRRIAYGKLANIINAKFNTQFTRKGLSQEITKIRSTYKRVMRKKRDDPAFQPRTWYVDLLSFLERKPSDMHDTQDVLAESASENKPADGEEGLNRRKRNPKSREHVYEIIELYKAAPILWHTKHHQPSLRIERKKAIEKIIATLNKKYDCQLTVEEFRYEIRLLRDAYFRAVRDEAAANQEDFANKYVYKPFFYSQMSFLEPIADKTPDPPDPPESNEDFKILIENRPLMTDFIELYKAHGCLWDQEDKYRSNTAAHSEAYAKIMNMFLQHNVIYTKEQVLSAIAFLHSTVVNTRKLYDTNNTSEPPIWFYEHLKFLGKIPHSLADYEKHKIEIAGDYPYKCAVCKAGFVSRSKYEYHQITHKEPQKCDQCGYQTYDRNNFNVHMRRHKGIYPFKCEQCDKGFVTSSELNRHMRTHTGEKPFICKVCGKALAANSQFQEHMIRHRNQRDHKCEICSSAFYTPKILQDHMLSHSSERQHVCEVCGAAFKRKKTLHQHKALHAEQKKYECKVCGKLFAQRAGVHSHMKSHVHFVCGS